MTMRSRNSVRLGRNSHLQSCLQIALTKVKRCPSLGFLQTRLPEWADNAAYVVGVITRCRLEKLILVLQIGTPTSSRCQSFLPTSSTGIESVKESKSRKVDMRFILLIINIL